MAQNKENKGMSPCKRYITMITIVALIGYSLYNAYLVINAYLKLSENVGEFGDLVENWQTKTILELSLNNTCPIGYEKAANDRVWPGVKAGCYCGDVSSTVLKQKNITCSPFCTSDCSIEMKSVGCKSVAPRDAQALTHWFERDSTPLQICVKRSNESFAGSATLTSPSGDCPSGYIKCGTSAENVFCTKEAKCPISGITIRAPSSPIGCNGAVDCFDVEGTTGSITKILTFTRSDNEDAKPLSEVSINENGMCNLKSKRDVTPGRPQFYLLNSKSSGCNQEGNNKWVISDTIKEYDLFKRNGLQTYIANLHVYDQPSVNLDGYYPLGKSGLDFNWHVFSRGYIDWKISCRDRLETLVGKGDFITQLKTGQLALLIIGMTSTAVLGFVLSFMEFQNLRGVDLSCISGKGEEERKKLLRIKKVLNYGFKLIQIPFQVWAIILTTKSKGLFADLADETCSTLDVQETLSFLSKTLNSTYQSNIIALGVLAGSLFLDLILMCCEKKDDAKNGGKNVTTISKDDPSKLDSSSNALNNTFNNSNYNDHSNMQLNQNPFSNQTRGVVSQTQPNGAQNIVINLQNPTPAPQTNLQMMPGQVPVGYNQQQQQQPYPQPQFIQQHPQQAAQQYPQQYQMNPQQQMGMQQYPQQGFQMR